MTNRCAGSHPEWKCSWSLENVEGRLHDQAIGVSWKDVQRREKRVGDCIRRAELRKSRMPRPTICRAARHI